MIESFNISPTVDGVAEREGGRERVESPVRMK